MTAKMGIAKAMREAAAKVAEGYRVPPDRKHESAAMEIHYHCTTYEASSAIAAAIRALPLPDGYPGREEAGCSRATWYRREKEAAEDEVLNEGKQLRG